MRGIIAPVLVHERDLSIVRSDLELALMFGFLEYDKRRHGQLREGVYDFFSKILWPIAFIQAGSENYIGIDGLQFFDLQFTITGFIENENTIGTIMKKEINDHQTRLNLLTDWKKEIKSPLKTDLKIKGVLGPEILHGLVPLIKLATDKPATSTILDPTSSSDDFIEITNKYNQTLKSIEQTISKWHLLQKNLQQIIEQWSNTASTEEKQELNLNYEELHKKILDNIWRCRNELDYILHWVLSGRVLNMIIPFTEIWISMYLAKIILPNKTQKFLLLPPSIFSEGLKSNRWVPVDSFHPSFYTILKEKIESTLEMQLDFRQKIETKCKAQNLFLNEDTDRLITNGYALIREKQIMEPKYIKLLQSEWQKASVPIRKMI
ncbi:MAG TPA: hypothetical protein VMV49_18095 [Candidatus Deferrimicrobium sp.]|nr:hypothetical protein [Candidatus Deferrimicrobium sp.]